MAFKGIIKTAEKPEEHNVIHVKNLTVLQLKVHTRTDFVLLLFSTFHGILVNC